MWKFRNNSHRSTIWIGSTLRETWDNNKKITLPFRDVCTTQMIFFRGSTIAEAAHNNAVVGRDKQNFWLLGFLWTNVYYVSIRGSFSATMFNICGKLQYHFPFALRTFFFFFRSLNPWIPSWKCDASRIVPSVTSHWWMDDTWVQRNIGRLSITCETALYYLDHEGRVSGDSMSIVEMHHLCPADDISVFSFLSQ